MKTKVKEIKISDEMYVIETEPFHSVVIIDKHILFSPKGVFRVKKKSDVEKALEGKVKPIARIPPFVEEVLKSIKAPIKGFIGAGIMLRLPDEKRDVYIFIPESLMGIEDGGKMAIKVIVTFAGETRLHSVAFDIEYGDYYSGVAALANIVSMVNGGYIDDIIKIANRSTTPS